MRVNVTEIVGQPGATRALDLDVPAEEFGDDWGPAEGLLGDEIGLDLHLDSVVDGILVRGSVSFDVQMACARCLRPLPTHLEVSVTELFVDPARFDAEELEAGYELVDDLTAVDLDTMVRDALLVDLPIRVLCDAECSGLCPECGAELDVTDCGHRGLDAIDPRWAALADLSLPPTQPPARPSD